MFAVWSRRCVTTSTDAADSLPRMIRATAWSFPAVDSTSPFEDRADNNGGRPNEATDVFILTLREPGRRALAALRPLASKSQQSRATDGSRVTGLLATTGLSGALQPACTK